MKRSRFSFCYGRCVLMKEIQKSQIAEKATAKMPKIYLPKCRKYICQNAEKQVCFWVNRRKYK